MEATKVWVVNLKGRHYQLRWIDPITGKTRTKTTKTNRRREAERQAAAKEKDLRAGRSDDIEWDAFRKRYEDRYLVDQAKATGDIVATVFNRVELVLPGLVYLRDLNEAMLAHLQENMRGEGLSIVTIKTYLGHLRAALAWAVRQKILAEVPHIEMPRRKQGSRMAKGRPLCLEEFERMLAAVEKVATTIERRRNDSKLSEDQKRLTNEEKSVVASWQYLLRGLWLSGLRLGEALQLSWEHDAPISVRMGGKYPELKLKADGHKGNRDELLPLSPEFCDFLLAVSESNRHGRVFRPMSRQTKSTAPMGVDWASKAISSIGKAAGIVVNRGTRKGKPHAKYASAHDLRRSFATRWAPKVMPATLQKLMRHKSIATTLNYYAAIESETVGDELRAKTLQPGHPCNTLRDIAPESEKTDCPAEKSESSKAAENKAAKQIEASGGYRARTGDLLAASQTLSQLS